MEPTIPTSFIPKNPVSGEVRPRAQSANGKRVVGLLTFITVITVIAAILSFVGVYLYEQRLTNQKQTLEQSITDARTDLGSDFVAEMQRLEQRIKGVKSLLASHVVISPIFEELQAQTLRSVRFTKFEYTIQQDMQTNQAVVDVSLSGVARSYAIVALQSDALAESKMFKNPVFSNLTLEEQTGNVNFSLTFTVDAADLSYQKFIEKRGMPLQQIPLVETGTVVQ